MKNVDWFLRTMNKSRIAIAVLFFLLNHQSSQSLFRLSRINQWLDIFRQIFICLGFSYCRQFDGVDVNAIQDHLCRSGRTNIWSFCLAFSTNFQKRWNRSNSCSQTMMFRRNFQKSWNRFFCFFQRMILFLSDWWNAVRRTHWLTSYCNPRIHLSVCTHWEQWRSAHYALVFCTSEADEIQYWSLGNGFGAVICNKATIGANRRSASRAFARKTNQNGIVYFATCNLDSRWITEIGGNTRLCSSYWNHYWEPKNCKYSSVSDYNRIIIRWNVHVLKFNKITYTRDHRNPWCCRM